MKQEYTAIKIWDNKNNQYIVAGYKQEWTKASFAKSAALNYWQEENRFTDKNNGWVYNSGVTFKDQTRFEVHEVKVTFEKVQTL